MGGKNRQCQRLSGFSNKRETSRYLSQIEHEIQKHGNRKPRAAPTPKKQKRRPKVLTQTLQNLLARSRLENHQRELRVIEERAGWLFRNRPSLVEQREEAGGGGVKDPGFIISIPQDTGLRALSLACLAAHIEEYAEYPELLSSCLRALEPWVVSRLSVLISQNFTFTDDVLECFLLSNDLSQLCVAGDVSPTAVERMIPRVSTLATALTWESDPDFLLSGFTSLSALSLHPTSVMPIAAIAKLLRSTACANLKRLSLRNISFTSVSPHPLTSIFVALDLDLLDIRQCDLPSDYMKELTSKGIRGKGTTVLFP